MRSPPVPRRNVQQPRRSGRRKAPATLPPRDQNLTMRQRQGMQNLQHICLSFPDFSGTVAIDKMVGIDFMNRLRFAMLARSLPGFVSLPGDDLHVPGFDGRFFFGKPPIPCRERLRPAATIPTSSADRAAISEVSDIAMLKSLLAWRSISAWKDFSSPLHAA